MNKSTLFFTSAIMLMAASLTFGAETVEAETVEAKTVEVDTSNKIFEENVETIWIDSNTGSPIDNPNAGDGNTRGVLGRCGSWQTVSQTTSCDFANVCVFHNQKKTVATTVQQRQCRNGIQQRTITKNKCGC